MDGFVNVPGYPKYLVNLEGAVYDTELKRFLKITSRKEFYPYVHLRNSERKPVRVWMRRIQSKSLLTGVIKDFDSQRDAAAFFGLSEAKISMVMENDNPVLPGMWQLRYVTKKDWLPVDDYFELLEKTTNGRCCAVWNDTQTFIYESCVEGAKAMGVSPTAFNYRLSTKGLKLIKGFYYGYYSDYKGRR